jgi:hypothetical protein
MTTERQRTANRGNACQSTGPRSSAGKRSASQNSYKHGLAGATFLGPETEIDDLARKIVGLSADYATLDSARAAAEAELFLVRVRRAKAALINRFLPGARKRSENRTAEAVRKALPDLIALERYERRALARRDRALRSLAGRAIMAACSK